MTAQIPDKILEGVRFKCKVKFMSPLPVTLVKVEFMVEACGALPATKIKHGYVRVNAFRVPH